MCVFGVGVCFGVDDDYNDDNNYTDNTVTAGTKRAVSNQRRIMVIIFLKAMTTATVAMHCAGDLLLLRLM